MNRKAFTLVEMLIVMVIVALLAVLAVNSYGAARRVARLDIVADSVVSSLKERLGRAKTGSVVVPENEGEESGPQCYGLFFSTEPESGKTAVERVETPYRPVGPQGADYCDLQQANVQTMDVIEDFKVLNIEKFGAEDQELLVLFKPPFARIVLGTMSSVTAPGAEYTQDIFITLGLPQGEGERTVRFNVASNVIERVYAEPTTQQ